MNYSLSRVGGLIKRDWTYHRKALLKPWSVFIGLNIIILIVHYFINSNPTPVFWSGWHMKVLFGFGLLSTYFVFPEFKDPQSKQQYLNVPATTLEKFSVRWLYSTLAVPLLITGVFVLFHLLAGGEASAFFSSKSIVVLGFIAANALIFLCASTFNNAGVGLNIFFMSLIAFIIVTAIILRIIFHPYFDGMSLSSNNIAMDVNFHNRTKTTIQNFLLVFVGMGLPIACWVISYYKLKEQEA